MRAYFTRLPRTGECPRVVWHLRRPWFYVYTEGGYEGYQVPFTRRRHAPDLPLYATRQSGECKACRGSRTIYGQPCPSCSPKNADPLEKP